MTDTKAAPFIKPTVGRIVWFFERLPSIGDTSKLVGPLAATISHVWDDLTVNLSVLSPNGQWNPIASVPLMQDGSGDTTTSRWCEWMPYQKGQAAKTEAAEAKAKGDFIAPMPETFDFGKAIRLLKGGHRVAREGWNGRGMFIYLNKGSFDGSMLGFPAGENPIFGHPSSIDGIGLDLFEGGDTGTVTRLPNVNMKSASGATVTGWLASQTDMLATDWMVSP